MQFIVETALTFRAADGPTHAPLVHAQVNGEDALLIVDTGSTDHILTTDLTDRVGMHREPGEPGTDSAGASVPSWLVHAAEVRVAGHEFRFRDLPVIDPPPPFSTGGIGGLLSPQHLHPNAYAVLDLVSDRLTVVDVGDELLVWLASQHPALRPLQLAAVAGEGTVLIRAGIEPYPDVVTMLDTGAKVTAFAASDLPDLAGGETRSSGRGVGGSESFATETLARTLRVGTARLPLPRLLLGAGHGEARGLIGMDLLRGTVLAVTSDPARPVIWLVP